MSEDKEMEDAEDSLSVSEDEEIDLDEVDESEELDEVDEVEKVEEPVTGAFLVIGQGDFSMSRSNRGADDPGDNTLCEPQYATVFGDMLFVSDRGNHRVLIWEQFPEENGEPSSLVLGQEDFADCLENRGITTTLDEMTSGLGDEDLDGFTISKSEEDTLSQPAGIAVIDGKLYVVDSGNHRVLRWGGIPTEDGEAPGLVLGQDNMDDNEANRRGFVGSGSLFFPMGIHSGDDKHVLVADKDNNRVLIWNKIPFSDGWNADVSLGQKGIDERWPNQGEFDNVGQDTLSFPTGVHFDAENERIFVVDQGNNRVLIWNKIPRETGAAADVVLGQKDFLSREPNRGNGPKRASADNLYFPTDVVYGKAGLFVSDSGNNRVLYWKEVPTENGQPADMVLGQSSLTENTYNRGWDDASNCTLNDPYGLSLIDEEEEEEEFRGIPRADDDDDDNEETALVEGESAEEPEEPQPKFKLFICDRGNSRIVVWNELPYPKEEKEEDEFEELRVDDENLLIGDEEDDDFYDEDDETPAGELPSA
jgi:DNA-binding beta-propeller fold protein YncE